ncbi:peptidoglycan hydrolase-like protein with peptidoglycan-binding domain [Pseudorhizobium tarimense]|uniref:Peptidoglycan hydrolase-like protein with peptidoglycan-binding domain n=1 Tax=Pseudorhizobium tarimense TaxID=1079109 RepID=A0ABV2H5M4_9HYPH|nr:L,D-transpeptidase family protein [Pseudorhizobium tarimense]MCJ8518924.1 L,D-transpeptidase family protein [Pseudorhizobium tarimense]
MLRRIAFGLGLLSATMLSHSVLAETAPTLQIIVSKDNQTMTVYDGDKVVGTSRVSTGKAGHRTPSGIFSILEKRKYHESNIYSNAPMPFMQRLTWSGIALHEGHVPSYPASHGCVRIPSDFAKTLFGMTERGVHVVISDEQVIPVPIRHANLFEPLKPLPTEPLMSDIELRPTVKRKTSAPYEVAMNSAERSPDMTVTSSISMEEDPAPLKMLIKRRDQRDTILDVQAMLNELGFDAGTPDGLAGSMTRSAIAGYKRWKELPAGGELLTQEFLDALYRSAGRDKPPAAQLMVRQNFKPVFEAPIGLSRPEIPLGTHFFTASDVDRKHETAKWHALTLTNVLSPSERQRMGIKADALPSTATEALDRLDIPSDIRERIGTLLSEGSSLTVTDEGLGPETGKGTDFITLTRSSATVAVTKPEPAQKPQRRRAAPRSYRNGVGLY